MKISIYSLITSIIISSIILTILCLIRRKVNFSRLAEVKVFIGLYILGFIRLLFPLDFNFTIGIPISGYFTIAWKVIFEERFDVLSYSISIGDLIGVIVITISIYRLMFFIVECIKEANIWKKEAELSTAQINNVHIQLRKHFFRIPVCKIIKSCNTTVPFVTGIIRKRIILPNIEYTDNELFYVLLHEYAHIQRHDLYKKLVLELFRCAFWWIPFKSFVLKDITQAMEIGCDRDITKNLSMSATIDYMQILLDSMKKDVSSDITKMSLAFAFIENKNAMVERFRLMSYEEKELKKKKDYGIILIGVLLILSSYIMELFPNFRPYNDESLNSYLVTENNTYLIYEDDIYLMSTESGAFIEISIEHAEKLLEMGITLKEEKNYEN